MTASHLRRWVLDPLVLGITALPRTLTSSRRIARLPLAIVMLLATLLVVYLVWAGLLYPLRSDAAGPGAWGGPTVAGAWVVHAAIALAIVHPLARPGTPAAGFTPASQFLGSGAVCGTTVERQCFGAREMAVRSCGRVVAGSRRTPPCRRSGMDSGYEPGDVSAASSSWSTLAAASARNAGAGAGTARRPRRLAPAGDLDPHSGAALSRRATTAVPQASVAVEERAHRSAEHVGRGA